jgi:tetratricopeptide (TPR) repeat protein
MKELSMIRFNGFDLSKWSSSHWAKGATALVLAASMTAVFIGDADAQRSRRDRPSEEEQAENAVERVFSARIGEIVLEAQTMQGEGLFSESIATLNRALAESSINPYERSISLQMRGRGYYEMENVQQAITDWNAAIATGAMLPSEIVSMRMNIGQLYITEGQYAQGIDIFQLAIREGGPEVLTPRLAKMLAQAYAQAERYREGLEYAEIAYAGTENKQRGDYSLMLFYYQQLENLPGQMRVVEEMVRIWPTEKRNWTTYTALLAMTGREEDAFEANKIMYVNGMLTESQELVRVAQYYSFYEYPYRGAAMFERELNAGRIERTQRNLSNLANMWRQAREWERAIPILRQVAQVTGDGDDYLKLAEALWNERQLAEAETAFQDALNRGGLARQGDAWTLLGNVRHQLGRRQSALAAFREGARYPYSRRTANGWISFVEGEIRRDATNAERRIQVVRDECRFTIEDRMTIARLVGDVNEEGRIVVEVPERCEDFYNVFGQTPEEAETERLLSASADESIDADAE